MKDPLKKYLVGNAYQDLYQQKRFTKRPKVKPRSMQVSKAEMLKEALKLLKKAGVQPTQIASEVDEPSIAGPKPKKVVKRPKATKEQIAKLNKARDAYFKKMGFGKYAKKNGKKKAA